MLSFLLDYLTLIISYGYCDCMSNHMSKYYQDIGIVCPPQLRNVSFTTRAVDNIDHNPSSTTSTGSFHSTWILLFENISIKMIKMGPVATTSSNHWWTKNNSQFVSDIHQNCFHKPSWWQCWMIVCVPPAQVMSRPTVKTYMAGITPEANISLAAYHTSDLFPSKILLSID